MEKYTLQLKPTSAKKKETAMANLVNLKEANARVLERLMSQDVYELELSEKGSTSNWS